MRHNPHPETSDGRTQLPAESPSSLGESLTIARIVKVVRLSLSFLALLALIAVYLGVSWFRGAMSDHQHWTGNEVHVHYVESVVIADFIARLDDPDGRTAIDWSTADRARVFSHLEALTTTAADRDETVDLAGRTEHLYAATIDYVDAVATARAGELADIFLRFRTAVADYLDATSHLETRNLDALSNKVDVLVLALAGILIVAAVILIGAWWLDEKVRNRESALLEEISKERTLLQTIIDALPESIIWKDTDSSVQGLNAALRDRLQLYGIAARPGQKLTDLPMGEEMAAYIAEVERLEQQVMESGEPVTDRQMVRPERAGRRQVVLRNAIPLRRAGNIVGVLSTTRDISQVVDLERSLAAASRMQSIGQLSAGVAHEINTPVQFVSDNTSFLDASFSGLIRAIEGLTEIAAEHDPEAAASIRKEADLDFLLEEIPDAIAQSGEGLAQIARIVTAMKRFAHPGGEIVETDIESLIRTTVDISRNAWKYHATVDIQVAPDTPRLMCDEGQIKQVLLNMIVNAADAIADRGGETGTITVAVTQDGGSMTIRISDTGTGMTEEVRERVFERFFTTKGAERGTGQGLAIAQDAVASHGGEILLDTEPGVGTTFTIVLPLRPPRDDNP